MTVGVSDCRSDEICGAKADFSDCLVGIVHFGVGAFHRAHQAVYTHDVLEKSGGDWRIMGVSLRSTNLADDLNQQNGSYSLMIRGKEESSLKIVKSIKSVIAAVRGMDEIYQYLSAPETKIVSMTLTEKAYGIDQNGALDLTHEAVAHDLSNPDKPKGIIGIITKGLQLRKELGLNAFTVLCCDNLSQNGDLVRSGVLSFADKIGETELAAWIADNATFPNTMVDRITPATTDALVGEIERSFGLRDAVPVETEAFSQWVIEDKFADGRPNWEDVGVLFVDDVKPYEHAKLRILNGSHSLIAYAGFLSGKKYVRDVMADDLFCDLVRSYMNSAVGTLEPLEQLDYQDYVEQLIERFKNPNIAHETYQIAMDGSQKMPQRIFASAVDALAAGNSLSPFAFATAAWIRYCSGADENGERYRLRDPREEELMQAFDDGSNNALKIVENFLAISSLFPETLIQSEIWKNEVGHHLKSMMEQGVYASIQPMLR